MLPNSHLARTVWGSLALFLVLPALVGLAWTYLGWKFPDGYSLGVYIGTGVAVLWYTIETYYLRQAMVRANEITVLPLVIARIQLIEVSGVRGQNFKKSLVLRNIGRGPALFVQIQDLSFSEPTLSVKFRTVDIIEEKQDVPAESQPYFGDAKVLDSFLANLDPQYANDSHEVTVTYEDVNRTKHTSVTLMGKGGIRLSRHG